MGREIVAQLHVVRHFADVFLAEFRTERRRDVACGQLEQITGEGGARDGPLESTVRNALGSHELDHLLCQHVRAEYVQGHAAADRVAATCSTVFIDNDIEAKRQSRLRCQINERMSLIVSGELIERIPCPVVSADVEVTAQPSGGQERIGGVIEVPRPEFHHAPTGTEHFVMAIAVRIEQLRVLRPEVLQRRAEHRVVDRIRDVDRTAWIAGRRRWGGVGSHLIVLPVLDVEDLGIRLDPVVDLVMAYRADLEAIDGP